MHKQVILIRADLKLPKGKTAAQASHASIEAAHKAHKEDYKTWRQEGMAKIVVKVDNLEALHKHIQTAKDAGLPTSTITDAGKTTVAPGTTTAGAIGPATQEKIDPITQHLKLL